ncbi:hypothetical protein ACIBAI_01825 [Streptomyces sp. NPDC051041]|uniref:hypothetical protein n=1 Tax=Streptomyces sp. NPDC051041 TaxID=3365640 RepID=UPI00378E14EC
MTRQPRGNAAPHPGPSTPPAVPSRSAGAAPGAGAGALVPGPPRRTAFAEGADRLRAAATTEPGRLRLIGALLALLVVSFGAVAAWQTTTRAAAAGDVLDGSQPLSSDAADVYRSLADANTAASSGFLVGGQGARAFDDRYEEDLRTAAAKLVKAAAGSDPGSPSAETITRLNRLLLEYKGLVERARTYNRQGFPVGGAYLRYADETMRKSMLPAAEDLYRRENQRLRADYADATAPPRAALALGVLALAALAWAQHRTYRRTNRVLNPGLAAATAATAAALLWLAAGHGVARAGLDDSYDHAVRSLDVLHDARVASLRARGNENLTLVARGAETVKVGGETVDAYDHEFRKDMDALGRGLARARELADDQAGEQPVARALGDVTEWRERHASARAEDENGNYQQALGRVIGAEGTTGECFDRVDGRLARALDHEENEFEQAAGDGRDAMAGLPAGVAVLTVLGAAGAVLGIGRRLSEYR